MSTRPAGRRWTIAVAVSSVAAVLLTAVPAHAAKPRPALIAYVGITAPGIYTVNLYGGHRTRLTARGVAAAHPNWTPSGNQIAYLVNAQGDGYRNVRVMRANGTRKRTLLGGGQVRHFFDLAWAPQGRRVAVTMQNTADTVHDVAIYTLRTRKLVRLHLFDTTGWRPTDIDWSADGQRLIFSAYRISDSNPHELDGVDLWTVRPNGTGLQQLTETPDVWERAPVWSPNGRRLAFTRSFNCETVMTANADGTNPQRIPGYCSQGADWGPAGVRLVVSLRDFVNESRLVSLIRPDGTGRKDLARGYDPAWRPR